MSNENVLKYVPANKEDEEALLQSALAVLRTRLDKAGDKMSPESMKEYLKLKYGGKFEHEIFGLALLDPMSRLIDTVKLADGTLTSTALSMREILKAALAVNAAYVVMFHTHPAQDATPSGPDISMTRRVIKALEPAEIQVLDHMIVAGDKVESMQDLGVFPNPQEDNIDRLRRVLPFLG